MLNLKNIRVRNKLYNFSAHAGERWLIQGATGSGKTTFLNGVAGLTSLQEGEIWWKNLSLTHLSCSQRPLSYLLQDCHVFPHLTVKQQINLMPCPWLGISLIGRYLSYHAPLKGHQLSGGEKRLLGLIRMLCEKRPILLLDESFVGIDPYLKGQIMEELKQHQIKTNCVILFTSHEEEDLKTFATHIYSPIPE